ncbi:hypothetical protein CBS9595_002940 [Malassezia furfur]|nr:hypothetical protein CBS9595_002940 [Malassezia furfur]
MLSLFYLAQSLFLLLLFPLYGHASVLKRGNNDPFYQPPAHWKSKQPGDILRWRKIEPKFIGGDFNVAEAYQLLYRTSQNTPNEPQHTVTTILVPHNAKKDILVVGSVAQDANGQQCTPSAGYTYNSESNFVFWLDETFFLQYLQEGYIMTIPDKEGPKNAFAAGRMEGYMTLDSIRATLNFSKLKLSSNTRIAGYGYSGGAITLGWASSLKPSYAPELNIIGWSFGGTPSNLLGTINHIDGTIFSGLILAGVTGVTDVYPEIHEYIQTVLNSAGREGLEFCRNHCLQEIILRYPLKSIYSYEFQTRGKDVFNNATVQQMFTDLTMGIRPHETPDVPVFMYHAQHDEIVPYDDAHKTAKAWCRNGAQVKFTTYSHYEMGHFTTEITGSVPAFHFIRDLFNGKEVSQGCDFKTEDTLFFNPSVLGGNANEIIDAILGIFGQRIGPEGRILAAKKTVVKGSKSGSSLKSHSHSQTHKHRKDVSTISNA